MLIDNLLYSYNGFTLQIGHLEIPDEKITSIIGPNGSGKTTFLKCIGGLLKPVRGRIVFKNMEILSIPPLKKARTISFAIGDIPKGFAIRVLDFVAMGRYPYSGLIGLSDEDWNIVWSILGETGLRELAHKRLDQLSSGELQKVLIARALVQEPKILLLDEPTSHLDLKHTLEILELIRKECARKHMTVLMSMHNVNMALKYSDYVIVLNNGRVKTSGKPQEILKPSLIEEVYGVKVEIVEIDGSKHIIPTAVSASYS